jgi:hypothetical protein
MTRRDILEDEIGKKLPTMRVFTLAIDFLRQDVLDTLSRHVDTIFFESDIHWVLTVPAIWNDAAKQFMREAAQQVYKCESILQHQLFLFIIKAIKLL